MQSAAWSTWTVLLQLWLQLEWLGITFLPACYFHFSCAVMATTGSKADGSQKWFIAGMYLISLGFLAALPFMLLVGPLVPNASPAPHLQRTWLTWIFALYFLAAVIWSWFNFRQSYRRTVTPTSRRRMRYLIIGALAPVLGVYPFLLFRLEHCHQPPTIVLAGSGDDQLFCPGTPGYHGLLGRLLWCILARPGGKTQIVQVVDAWPGDCFDRSGNNHYCPAGG